MNIGGAAFTTVMNILSNFMFSMDFAQHDSASAQEFQEAVWTLLEIVGKPNLADFFPILQPLDPQGLYGRANGYLEKLLTIVNRIIDQRLQTRSSSSSTNNDVLDSLLNIINLKDESEFSRNDMAHLFVVSKSL